MRAARITSLLDGVYEAAAKQLGVANLSHRSALLKLRPFDGKALIATIHDTIRRNYDLTGASANKDRSAQNWRWHVPQPQIGAGNTSPEVVVERAIAAAAVALGREDWSNQIPVASGLVGNAGDRRRAIDLVRRIGERHFQMIELKIASDTPLYAAAELAGYACLWLVARDDKPARPSALLDADTLDLRVLAPSAFYARYALREVERAIHAGVHALGERHGVAMTFAYEVLDARIRAGLMPPPGERLDLVDNPARLHPA